jgi:hypothetical protein
VEQGTTAVSPVSALRETLKTHDGCIEEWDDAFKSLGRGVPIAHHYGEKVCIVCRGTHVREVVTQYQRFRDTAYNAARIGLECHTNEFCRLRFYYVVRWSAE